MQVRIDESSMIHIIAEEMTKGEISSLIASKIGDSVNSRDFKKKVKEIAAEVVSEVFKTLWQRNSFWKPSVTNC
jgi:methionyl-tRNA formyltransferase